MGQDEPSTEKQGDHTSFEIIMEKGTDNYPEDSSSYSENHESNQHDEAVAESTSDDDYKPSGSTDNKVEYLYVENETTGVSTAIGNLHREDSNSQEKEDTTYTENYEGDEHEGSTTKLANEKNAITNFDTETSSSNYDNENTENLQDFTEGIVADSSADDENKIYGGMKEYKVQDLYVENKGTGDSTNIEDLYKEDSISNYESTTEMQQEDHTSPDKSKEDDFPEMHETDESEEGRSYSENYGSDQHEGTIVESTGDMNFKPSGSTNKKVKDLYVENLNKEDRISHIESTTEKQLEDHTSPDKSKEDGKDDFPETYDTDDSEEGSSYPENYESDQNEGTVAESIGDDDYEPSGSKDEKVEDLYVKNEVTDGSTIIENLYGEKIITQDESTTVKQQEDGTSSVKSMDNGTDDYPETFDNGA